MNNLRDKKSNPVITLIAVVISLFFLPAIAAGLGTMGEIYIDGLRELPSFGIKAISVAIWMLLVAYLMCCFMKAKKDFIRLPAILGCVWETNNIVRLRYRGWVYSRAIRRFQGLWP
ncbi:TPA: hypothetical protein ACHFYU_004766 [Escherichia coli]